MQQMLASKTRGSYKNGHVTKVTMSLLSIIVSSLSFTCCFSRKINCSFIAPLSLPILKLIHAALMESIFVLT